MTSLLLNEQIMETVTTDQSVRTTLTKQSILYFATVYFPHYFGYGFSPFQYEMLQIVEDKKCQFAVIITFRGSGKSTLLTTITPLWGIMGSHEKKHVLLVCQTQEQARSHMASIKAELESNELLRSDLGPFKETSDKWSAMTLEFSKYGARITAASIDQNIRGLRHRQHRPDLIICDDIEDSSSVKTKEGRKHIHDLYSSEIVPLGDKDTKIVMVGNHLHPNSLLTTLRDRVKIGRLEGREMFVPLINDENQIAWPQKFTSLKSLNQLREQVADERIWMQEYMLKIVADDDQIVSYSDIVYYDDIPRGWEPNYKFRAAGIDLAISKDEKADYTAIVSGDVYVRRSEHYVFIARNPTNARFNFRETIDFLHSFRSSFPNTHLFIEGTGYQRSLVEELNEESIDAHEVQLGNLSKQERLALVVQWISKGFIRFPKDGATDLVNQIVNLGAESHDDLVDAFTLLITQVMKYAHDGNVPVSIDQYFGPMYIDTVGGRSFRDTVVYNALAGERLNLRTLDNDPFGWQTKPTLRV